MTETQEVSLDGLPADIPEVKPKHPGGRPSKESRVTDVQAILDGTAVSAAEVLKGLIEQKKGKKMIKAGLQRACEYVIDHAIGKAKQKIEHSGGIMTYGQLAKSAESLASKSRPFLADTEELSAKSLSAEENN